jgi:sulfide dehydrogenase [flavocytochrome c] flavoprotein subunit
MPSQKRRSLIQSLGAGGALAALPHFARGAEPAAKSSRRVVVVGGGFGGTIAAKTLRFADPSLEITLVERNRLFTACPGSNLVLGGTRRIEANQFGYENLAAKHGIKVVHDEVSGLDAANKTLKLAAGTIAYDRLIVSPGIDFRFAELRGYDPVETPKVIPHAWKAGEQTLLLRRQLEAMADGGTVVINVPLPQFRCPPGPYERICQIAWYLKQAKPKSKIIVLDANPDILSKPALFRKAWAKHYPGMIDYRASQGVVGVTTATKTVHTETEDIRGDVVNLIPPQRAADFALAAGLVPAGQHWCPVDPTTYESKLLPGVHVIGDACDAAPMPKSGFSANTQAKVCGLNVAALLNDRKPIEPSTANVCYSFVSDREAVSIAAVYKAEDGKIVAVKGAGGLSPDLSETEAQFGRAWLANILAEMSS